MSGEPENCAAKPASALRLATRLHPRLAERKSGKNRVHPDVRVGAENLAAVVARLTERGATFLHNGQQGPHRWVTLADPEGNEFCVT